MVSPMCQLCGKVQGAVAAYDKSKTGIEFAHRKCLSQWRKKNSSPPIPGALGRSDPIPDGPGAAAPIFKRMATGTNIFRRMVQWDEK